jgi:ABC-type multidrug transport system fused ATPase/permease subunit
MAPGDGMPSVREVAQALALNPMTVSKAYGLLEMEGVLARRRGWAWSSPSAPAPGRPTARELLRPDARTRRPVEARQLELDPDTVLTLFMPHPEGTNEQSQPIVQMSSISKHFGAPRCSTGLDWQVAPGQVIGLLGRNGAGKSTLLECLLGLRETDGGGVSLFGEDVAALSDATRARIGYVPQKSDLFDWLTPRQMLEYFQAMYPRWNEAKVERPAVALGLRSGHAEQADQANCRAASSSACRSSARWRTSPTC